MKHRPDDVTNAKNKNWEKQRALTFVTTPKWVLPSSHTTVRAASGHVVTSLVS